MATDPRSDGAESDDDTCALESSRRTAIQLGALGAAGLAGCFHGAGDKTPSPGGEPPDTDSPTPTPSPTPLASPETVKGDLTRWAQIEKADGENGRPLPVAGPWGSGGFWRAPWKTGDGYTEPEGFTPKYVNDLIKNGHHTVPCFQGVSIVGKGGYFQWDSVDVEQLITDQLHPEALDYLAEHRLPFAMIDGNYIGKHVTQFEKWRKQRTDWKQTTETTASLVKNGSIKRRQGSPIGPIEGWRAAGREWMGNPLVEQLAERYPDPPRIVFLDNDEIGHIGPSAITTDADRFVEKFGEETIANMSEERKAEIIHEGYEKRYQAMFDAAREAAPDGWADAMTFVGYNSWGAGGAPDVLGRQSKWNSWTLDRRHDGSMPEYYDNGWESQEGKSDHSPWSLQAEACNVASLQDRFFEEDPDHYFSNIGWEGGPPNGVNPEYRGFARKPNQYIVGDLGESSQEWDFDRFQGLLQFGLWTMRPRSFRTFMGGVTANAYYQEMFGLYPEMVDRVWANEEFHEFWKHGDLVPNDQEEHFFNNLPNAPDWVTELDRWFILPCDANPPRSEWESIDERSDLPPDFPFAPYPSWKVDLRVFPMALKLGEEPERRWLLYAHAPLGAVPDATISLPGYGDVTLDHVSKNGTFAIVEEADETVSIARQGGPAQLNVEAASEVVAPGESVDVTAEVGCPPSSGFSSFTWEFAGKTTESDSLGTETLSFDEPGQHQIKVTGTTGGGGEVAATTTVRVGGEPSSDLVYDVPLDKASAYEGPWGAVGEEFPGELQTYRLAPNPGGAGPRAPVHGGEIVEDADLGRRVLELSGNEDGLWLVRSGLTSQLSRGHASKTIKLRFKAESVEGKQWLYKEGGSKGFRIYIEGGTVFAGTWGQEGTNELQADVSAGKWHHIALVLDSAGIEVTDGAMSLYLDGEQVATGPGVRIPNHSLGPKVGWGGPRVDDNARRRGGNEFIGRIADFVQANDARPPR